MQSESAGILKFGFGIVSWSICCRSWVLRKDHFEKIVPRLDETLVFGGRGPAATAVGGSANSVAGALGGRCGGSGGVRGGPHCTGN